MKMIKDKLVNFIVDKRNYILVLFIFTAIISLLLSNKVNINHDISAYLPDSSETKIGKNIMDDNFSGFSTSTLNLMFKGLEEDKHESVKNTLENIDGVKEVEYDSTDDYNKEDYTLYIITVDDKEDSTLAKEVYEEITEKFASYQISTSGNVSEWNKPVLHLWIIAFAIVCAMIILIIMCESYVEPFLFLFSIGLAVFINMGTNIIFSSVSHITNSIAAILQLALSMDYSIMLMNRYSQERENEKDKLRAMKKALSQAMSSIASSSITTIVGLLALVFMSFTIGRDLGFVLAKGVLLSLISIFLSLPALILLFDKIILKTKKKSLNIKMNHIGKFVYNFRHLALFLFIIIFVISFVLKDGVSILYTGSENDEIASVFSENNQIAIVYKNDKEDKVSQFVREIDDDKVEALSFGTTIGDKIRYGEVNDKISSLGIDAEIDDYIIKLVYYNFYNKNNDSKMTIDEFVSFINKTVLTNADLSSNLDKNTKSNIKKLSEFSEKTKINKKRNSKNIASVLDVDETLIKDILVLYNAKNPTNKMTIDEFVKFINSSVLTNKTYASMIGESEKQSLAKITPFMDNSVINTEINSNGLAKLFGIDKSVADALLVLAYGSRENNIKLSLKDILVGVDYLEKNTEYLKGVDLTSLKKLSVFIYNKNNINNTKLDRTHLKEVFAGINSNLVDLVYTNAKLPDTYTFTPLEFINFVINNFSLYLSENDINNLKLLSIVINSANNNTTYTATEIGNILGVDKSLMYKLYALISINNGQEFKLSPYKFVNLILNNQAMLKDSIDESTVKNLKLLNAVMTSINNRSSYTPKEISSLLGLKENDVKLIYSLKMSQKNNLTVSLLDLTNFILDDVVTDKKYQSYFDKKSIKKLEAINKVMKSSLKREKLKSSEIYVILSNLTDSLDENLVDLVYIYNGSVKNYDSEYTLSLEELVNYLNNDILKDEVFEDFLDTDMKDKIKSADEKISSAKDLLVSDNYSRVILNTKYFFEGEETFNFIEKLKNGLNDDGIYVIGDSPMAYEMSKSFNDELDFITVLTMIAIFAVVAITFKSLIVPFILVLIIECAVYVTMSILSLTGSSVYFISLLIVQSILMGATIDYAIVYTTYYIELRGKRMAIKEAIIESYNKSIHTILCSSSILVIVTLIVGCFASQIAAKICMTLSKGSLCAALLILFILPPILAICDKFIIKSQSGVK